MSQTHPILFQSGEITHSRIPTGGHDAEGIEIHLPGSPQYFLMIRCKRGLLACRLVSPEVSEALGLSIAVFSAARLGDILAGRPVSLSQSALAMGATTDMTGAELVELFSAVEG